MSARTVLIQGFPRVHLALIDVGRATQRLFGGVGFSLNHQPVEISASLSDRDEIVGLDTIPDIRVRKQVREAAENLREEVPLAPTRLQILAAPPSHVGFGTTTALILTALKALIEVNQKSVSVEGLQRWSGRGGTSGIGVHAFFRGGVLADGGHPRVAEEQPLPSSARRFRRTPPLLTAIPFPLAWNITLLLPHGKTRAGEAERKFFELHTPVPDEEILAVLAAVYHGVLPAMASQDLALLRQALLRIHRVGFKRREVEGQSQLVRDLLQALAQQTEVAAGMSSMGPLIFCISRGGLAETPKAIRTIAEAYGLEPLAQCSARNRGYEVDRNGRGPRD